MITFSVERFSDELEYLKPILPEHYKELALNQDQVPLDPQYDKYIDMENEGKLLFVVARELSEIVGYFIGFVSPSLHYQTCLTLSMDIFYTIERVRGQGTGFHLFRFVEQEAKNRGVQRMFVGSKMHKDASWLFEKLGYSPVETYYSHWLGELPSSLLP